MAKMGDGRKTPDAARPSDPETILGGRQKIIVNPLGKAYLGETKRLQLIAVIGVWLVISV